MILLIVELGQVHSRQIADSPAWQTLLPTWVRTNDRIEIPAVRHLIIIFHEHNARLSGFPSRFDNGAPYITRFNGAIMNNIFARSLPLVEIAIPHIVIFRVCGIREH
ncbi:hypothetical protein D3C76_648920 [compost metagenome]